MNILIKNGFVFDSAGGKDQPAKQDILIANGSIAALGEEIPVSPTGNLEIIDAADKLVIPGLVNSHLHSHDHFDRGRFENLPLELWILFIRPWIGAKPLTPRELYLRTIIGAMEMVRTGTTLAIDDVNLAPFNTPENLRAVMQAYRDVGMRALVGASVFDKPAYQSVPYVETLLPQAIRSAMDQTTKAEDWLVFLKDSLQAWSDPEGLTRFILAPSAPQRCTDRLLVDLKKLAEDSRTLLMTHTLETKVQKVTGQAFYGKSIIAHLEDLGVLGENLALVHCVWASDEDLDRIAVRGASVVHCPVSNLKLGSGVAPLEKMIQRGIRIGLGTDNTSCNDSQNLFEVMKFAALLPKVRHGEFSHWPEAKDILRMATAGGAGIARLKGKIGMIEPGGNADLAILDLRTASFRPVGRIDRNLVFSENGRSVTTAIVNGKVVLEDGKITGVNESDLHREILEAAERLKKEHHSIYEKAQEIYPYFKEAYGRCHQEFARLEREGKL